MAEIMNEAGKPDMQRTILAFLVAPLWGPIFLGAALSFVRGHWGPHSWQDMACGALIGAVIAYAGTLALGVPAYMIFRRLGWSRLWLATVTGATAGWVAAAVAIGWITADLGVAAKTRGMETPAYSLVEEASYLPRILMFPLTWLGAIPGFAVGATLWVIDRPARRTRHRPAARPSSV